MDFFGGGDKKPSKKVQGDLSPEEKAKLRKKQADAAQQQPDEAKVIEAHETMQDGDYQVHIHILKGKNFKLDNEDEIDPFIKFKLLGQEKSSVAKSNVMFDTKVTWDEHIFFEFHKLTSEEIENAELKIMAENRGFFKGDLIGEFTIGVQKIYSQKNHAMRYQTVGLNNPEGGHFTDITGYLTVSIQVIGPTDEAIELNMVDDQQIAINKPLLPTQVKLTYKQLYIRFFMAENLPIMDSNLMDPDSIDAYLKIKYNNTTIRTKVYTMKDRRVFWNQEVMIPVEIPLREEKIKIQLWDADSFVDEFVCTVDVSVKSILKFERKDYREGPSRMKWINFYGPPPKTSGEEADKMRRDPTVASDWQGRVLVEWFCMEAKYPIFKIRNILDQNVIKRSGDHLKKKRYKIIAEVGQGITLPGTENYSLSINFGTHTYTTKAKKIRRNYARWDTRFPADKEDFTDTYQHLKEFPTLYIYLIDEAGDRVCFYRDSILKFTRFYESDKPAADGPYQWLQFEPDLAVGKVTNPMKAGIFSIRLYIHDMDDGPFDSSQIPAWQKRPPKLLNPFRMRAAIYQCESLPPADTEGHSDPYVEVWSADEADTKRITTTVCQDTNNPIFYEVREFNMEFKESSLDSAMPIVLNIYDQDDGLFDDKDDLIGRAIIHLSTLEQKGLLSKDDTIPPPQWFPVKKTMNEVYDKVTGAAILCSFQMIPRQDLYTVKDANSIELDNPSFEKEPGIPYPMPNLDIKEYQVQIIVLGLRDLVSTGLFDVNKAYVQFNLKSLLSSAKARAVNNIQTMPRDKGANPNIRTTIQFEVQMPSSEHLCPKMTCDVYDLVFMQGLSQPHIGTFALELGKSASRLITRAESMYREMTNINSKLIELRNLVSSRRNLGQEVTVIDLVNEQVSPRKAARKGARKSKNEDKIREGARVLQEINAAGIKLPDTMDKTLKRKKPQVEAGEEEEQAAVDNQNDDGLFEAEDAEGKNAVDLNDSSMMADQEIHADLNLESLKRKLGSKMRKQVEAAFFKQIEDQKNALDRAREFSQRDLIRRTDGQNNIIKPQYELDERLNVQVEVNAPPDTLFLEIGHDPKPGAKKKHYRRYYPDELEEVLDKDGHALISSPFINAPIYRARAKKQQSLLSSFFQTDDDQEMLVTQTGIFKGIVRAFEPGVKDQLERKIFTELRDLLHNAAEVLQDQKAVDNANQLLDIIINKGKRDSRGEQQSLEKRLNILRKGLNQAGLARFGIHPLVAEIVFQYTIMNKLNALEECKVRIYALEGFNFAKRDMFSQSDPFLVLKLGDKVINDRENYKLDTNCPDFYTHYDFYTHFPGAPMLEIEAYDQDGFFGDELIGKTKIDLDDRYYSLAWQSMDDSPVEFRDLYHPSSTVTQGVLKMWVEINEKDSKNAQRKPIDVHPRPLRYNEVRIVVWRTRGIPAMDIEGTSDIQIRAGFDSNKMYKTDTHWRSQNGEGSFNYRLLIPFSNKTKNCDLRIEAIDRDIVKNNDIIGGCNLDLTAMRKDLIDSQKRMVFHKTYFEEYLAAKMQEVSSDTNQITFDEDDKQKFWVPIKKLNQETGVNEDHGEILITLHMVPEQEAKDDPQGEGRQEPNNDPYCPEPEGRIKFTINPFEMLGQMIPASAWYKMLRIFLCGLCCFMLALMAPMIVSDMIANSI